MITKQIWAKIKEYQTVIILRHINPDGDAYGVQFGLKHLIAANLPETKVFVPGATVSDFNYIGSCDEATPSDYETALVIVGDCAISNRIDSTMWKQAAYKIKIDHHPFQEKFADLEWIDAMMPSASEMIAKLAFENDLKIPPAAAQAIFHGMVTDTGRFLYGELQPTTFAIAGRLLETGFDLKSLYQNLYTKSLAEVKFQAYILSEFTTTANGVAYLKLDAAVLKKFGLNKEKANSFVNLLGNIQQVKIWLLCSQDETEAVIKLSVRSSNLKINDIAYQYGGGGHDRAAGIKTNSWVNVDKIIQELDNLARNN